MWTTWPSNDFTLNIKLCWINYIDVHLYILNVRFTSLKLVSKGKIGDPAS